MIFPEKQIIKSNVWSSESNRKFAFRLLIVTNIFKEE